MTCKFAILALVTVACDFLPIFGAQAASWKTFTEQDGLPSNEIQFVKETPPGTVWVGTLGGLARFDGAKIQPTPVDAGAWDVLPDGNAALVGTDRGLVRIAGDQAETILGGKLVAPLLRFGKSTVLALAKDRTTEASTLMAGTGNQFEPVELLAEEHAPDMEQTPDGRVWVSVDGRGVYVFNPKVGLDKAAHHLDRQNVTTVYQDAKGRVWCGLWARGLAVYQDKLWNYHLDGEKIYPFAIRQSKDGTIWVATDQAGLWRYDGKEWTNEFREEGAVNLLEVTRDGRVWISTQTTGGLRSFDGNRWQTELRGPLPIRCLLETSNGQILAGGVLDGLHLMK